jgi:hypothetical protein
MAKGTLAMTGVFAAACLDLGLNAEQAEMLFLQLRLSGAAVHALEQQQLGWKKFPYVSQLIDLQKDAPVVCLCLILRILVYENLIRAV